MNFPRFFLSEPGFACQLEACLKSRDDFLRPNGLLLFAYDVCTWFDENPGLTSIKLSGIARAEVCETGYEVRMRHHLKLSCIQDGTGTFRSLEFPKGTDAVEDYVTDRLPWQMLADGTCTLQRTDPLVVKVLALPDEDIVDIEAAMYHLAMHIASAFKTPAVISDLGMANVYTE